MSPGGDPALMLGGRSAALGNQGSGLDDLGITF